MKAVILNSGIGSRMGSFTDNNHKSMVEIKDGIKLIEHQIKVLSDSSITNIVITTGHMESKIKELLLDKFPDLEIEFIFNPRYLETNYIYSIYLALDKLDEDIILLHGDLYFDEKILNLILESKERCIVVDSTLPLPEKDFKAQVVENKVTKIATYINNNDCISCQPLYKLNIQDWKIWSDRIARFCEEGKINVYAEEALNEVLNEIYLKPIDLKGKVCMEVDTMEDLDSLKSKI